MPQPLVELLVSIGAAKPEQIQQVQARQADLGGSLDTNLLELGVVDEQRLTEVLVRAADLPLGPPELMTSAGPPLATLFPQALAEKYGMVPLGVARRQLSLLVRYPLNLLVLDEISFLLSRPIRPYLAPEVRVQELLARVYRVPLPARYQALLAKLNAPPEDRTPPGDGPALEGPGVGGTPSAPEPARETAAPHPFIPVPEAPTPRSVAGPAPQSRPARMTPAEALVRLREAGTRDEVIEAAISFVRGAFQFVALYTRRGTSMAVFEAAGIDLQAADRELATVPLDRSSSLRMVCDARAPYVGPVLPGDPLERALGALGRSRLRAVLLYPVVIRDRTVAVVYGDSAGEALAPRRLSDVALVLSQVGPALERVLRTSKSEGATAGAVAAGDGEAPTIEAPPVEVPPSPLEVDSPTSPRAPSEPLLPDEAANLAEALGAIEVDPIRVTALQAPLPTPPNFPAAAAPAPAAPEPVLLPEYDEIELPDDWNAPEEGGTYHDLVRAFLSGNAETRADAEARLRLGGVAAARAVVERFPGPLYVFRMALDELPGPEGIGPLAGLLAAIGVDSVVPLAELLDEAGEERRFWATVLLAKLAYPEALLPLLNRLFDAAPDVAAAARRGLFLLRGAPDFPKALEQLEGELQGTDPERLRRAIRTLGQLHHVAAVPRLIELCASRDSGIEEAAGDALREIARQDFGSNAKQWASWWAEAQRHPRALWLIEALAHKEPDIRASAFGELTAATGLHFGYNTDLPPRERQLSVERWRDWWAGEGWTKSFSF
jgi:hypothetical protein